MPRIRQNAAQYQKEDFLRAIRMGQAQTGLMHKNALADAIGIARSTLYEHLDRALKMSIVNLTEDIASLEYESRRIKSATADGSPVHGGGSGREDRLLSNIVDRDEKRAVLDRTKKTVAGVERGLSVLNEAERHILDVMYINPPNDSPVVELMDEFELADRTSVYRRVNKALMRFTTAMYGCTES